jgi:hypothetical protein
MICELTSWRQYGYGCVLMSPRPSKSQPTLYTARLQVRRFAAIRAVPNHSEETHANATVADAICAWS